MEKAVKRYMPIFVLPTFFAFILGFIIPFIMGIWLSFCEFTTVTDAKFVGISNYIEALKDTVFRHSFWYTCLFAAVSLIVINVFAFALAMALTQKMKGTNIFRTIFFMPNLIGGIVLGYIWQLIFNGILAKYQTALGFKRVVRLLGVDHPCELAADRIYDDHLHRGAPVDPGRRDGSGADRRRVRDPEAFPGDDPHDDAVHYDLYVPVHH